MTTNCALLSRNFLKPNKTWTNCRRKSLDLVNIRITKLENLMVLVTKSSYLKKVLGEWVKLAVI